jgi:hypothetical protein
MTEAHAKKQLRLMLRSMTPGSVLHLLSELFTEQAEHAHDGGDELACKRAREVAATLFVVGLGLDAVCPR